MSDFNDILIFGVRNNAQTPDTGFIVTPEEFGQMLGDAPDVLLDEIRGARAAFGSGVWAGFDKDGESYSVRMVKMVEDISHDVEGAAAYMAKSIVSYGNVPFAFPSQSARETLSKFLTPMIQVTPHSRYAVWQGQELVNTTAWDHVCDVRSIFSACGLMHVERHRSSVTQGEASVLIGSNQTAVRYGDNIFLPSSDELMNMGSSPSVIEASYGPIIGGWVSRNTNNYLLQQSLIQYPERIRDALCSPDLLPLKTSVSLDSRISDARQRTTAPEQASGNDISR